MVRGEAADALEAQSGRGNFGGEGQRAGELGAVDGDLSPLVQEHVDDRGHDCARVGDSQGSRAEGNGLRKINNGRNLFGNLYKENSRGSLWRCVGARCGRRSAWCGVRIGMQGGVVLLVARAARVPVVFGAVLHLMRAQAEEAAVDSLDKSVAVGRLHLLVLGAG